MITTNDTLKHYWPDICRAYDNDEKHRLMGPHLRRFWYEMAQVLKVYRAESYWKAINNTRQIWKVQLMNKFCLSEPFFKDRTPDEVVTALELRALEKMTRIQAGDIPDLTCMIRLALVPIYKNYLSDPDSEEELPF